MVMGDRNRLPGNEASVQSCAMELDNLVMGLVPNNQQWN
jgi:hypothetical protein